MDKNKLLFNRAIEHIKSNNYKRASDYFYAILKEDGENENAWTLLGFCLINLEKFEKAYISFNNALKINNKNSFAWSGKAYLLFLTKEYGKALIYCDFALEYYPENECALKIKNEIRDILSNGKGSSENCEIEEDKTDKTTPNKKLEIEENGSNKTSEEKAIRKEHKFNIENILNSFNDQDKENYFIEEDDEYMTVKLKKPDLNKKDGYTTISDMNEFKNIFTKKHIELLLENPLTVSEFNNILLKIKEVAKNNFKDIISENDINLSEISIFKKISLLALSFTDVEYKTKGADLGHYGFNVIRVDERLDESKQISTMIHELSHHILNEIFTQSLMHIWNSDKTNAIEAISAYSISSSKSYRLMNEYCAHTVQGRFLPFGYQNYGTFNMLLKKFDAEKDKEKIKFYLRLGNSFAEEITEILEEFILKTWRDEIKEQFKKDFANPPHYDDIFFETRKTFPVEEIVENINIILTRGIFSIAINEDMELIKELKKRYEKK